MEKDITPADEPGKTNQAVTNDFDGTTWEQARQRALVDKNDLQWYELVLAAEQDLLFMAGQGIKDWHGKKFEFSSQRWEKWQELSETTFDLMPMSLRTPDNTRASGFFHGLILTDILDKCFEHDALEFILQHSYNDYLFWFMTDSVVCGRVAADFPYSLEYVKECLLDGRTPFDHSAAIYTHHIPKLKATIADHGGQLDINKLDASYGFFLIECGLLLKTKSDVHSGNTPILVLNPMWAHFVEKLSIGKVA